MPINNTVQCVKYINFALFIYVRPNPSTQCIFATTRCSLMKMVQLVLKYKDSVDNFLHLYATHLSKI